MSYFGYIEPRELAEQLRSEAVAVIDVRDEDFDEDGFIPDATNVPSEKWDDTELIDSLITSHEGKSKVVFHCKMSKVRGPSCATKYIERRNEILSENPSANVPEVLVLSGGYRQWKQTYGETEGMIATNKG